MNETFESVHRSFLSVAGVKNDEEFFSKAQSQFQTFQNTIKSGIDDLNEEVSLMWKLLCSMLANANLYWMILQTKPLQTQAQDLVKAFIARIDEVGNELKAKNPELFSGDTKKLQVSSNKSNRCFFRLEIQNLN